MKAVLSQLAGRSVFKDQSVLSFDYVPEELPHREADAGKLATLFRPLLTSRIAASALITGRNGTGKTALAKRFAADLREAGAAHGVGIEHAYINCRKRRSESAVLLKLVEHFDPHFPDRGFSPGEMLDILRKHIRSRGVHLVVLLDEADALLRHAGSDVVYTLTRFGEEEGSTKSLLSLVLISLTDPTLYMDASSLSTFGTANEVHLEPYSEEALYDILAARAALAFREGAVDDEVLRLVAQMAAVEGNARQAIEILRLAGTRADARSSPVVGPEDTRVSKGRITLVEGRLEDLRLHEGLVLLAASRLLKDRGFVTTGELEERYALVAEEYGQTPRKHTTFWEYIKRLEAFGFVTTSRTQPSKEGNTQRIALHDLAAKDLARLLERAIHQGRLGP